MSKIALYEKHHGDSDRAVFAFYRRDYIYRRNMWTRLSVCIGAFILLGVYWLHRIFIMGEDLLAVDLQKAAWDAGTFVIAIMIFYTVVGTLQGTRQYYLTQKRIARYKNMLALLERIEERETNGASETERTDEKTVRRRERTAAGHRTEQHRRGVDLYYGSPVNRKGRRY